MSPDKARHTSRTKLQSEGAESPLLHRASIYKLLSSGFSFPSRETFVQLTPLFPLLEASPALQPPLLETLEQEYQGLFMGEVLCPPYETSYDASTRKGKELGDIAGFYQAFGLRLSDEEKEMVDHISVEMEFMGHLLLKESKASAQLWKEQEEITRDAERKFFSDHLGRWALTFVRHLEETCHASSTSNFYSHLAGLLRRFLTEESAALGARLAPAREKRALEPIEEETCSLGRIHPNSCEEG